MSYIILYACDDDAHGISEIVFPNQEDAEQHLVGLQKTIEMRWWDIRRVVVM